MDVHLLDNTTLGWEPYTHASIDQQVANAWHPTTAGYVNALRYRRDASEPNPWPDYLTLWRASDGVKMAEVQISADPGGASDAWVTVELAESIPVANSVVYVVAAHYPPGHGRFQGLYSGAGTPPTGLAWTTPVFRYLNSGGNAYPTSTDASYVNAVDVAFDTTPSHTPSTGIPEVTGNLADWLDTETGTQEHSAPLLTYQAVTDGDTGLEAIAGNIGSIMGASWSSAADTLHQIGTKVASILTKVTDGPLPGIAGLETLANTIIDALEAAAEYMAHPNTGGAGALANNPPLPGTGWNLIAEADFDDCDTITVQCHLIVLDFSAFPVSRPAHNVCGVPIRYRLGWWCPMNGDFAGPRQFIDFEKMHVQDAGRLMNGALIVCEPGTSGHWQAWLLS